MGPVPAWARVYVGCAVVGALVRLAPPPGIRTPWWVVHLLAVVYAGLEELRLGAARDYRPEVVESLARVLPRGGLTLWSAG